jgi:hypothetical protein
MSIVRWAKATAKHEGFHEPSILWPIGSLSWRNRNPGNLVFGPLAKKHGATTFYKHPITGHQFAIFPTLDNGWAALENLLENAATGKSQIYWPDMTLLQFYTKYSPVRDMKGNVVPNYAYAEDVAKQLGVSVQIPIKNLAVEAPQTEDFALYSQRDPKWCKVPLGFGKTTIGSHGCFLTSLAMMVQQEPDKVNEILKKKKAFYQDLIISEKAATALNLDYFGREYLIDNEPNWFPSIKEVDMSPVPGKQQHFTVRIMRDGRKYIADPWDGQVKRISYYPFVSYRLFKLKK